MGFNFPAGPTVGQTYSPGAGLPVYQWTGEKWKCLVAIGAVASAYISDTPPSAPLSGMLWWESDTGLLYIWYDDGSSSQWVLVGNFPSLTGLVRYDAAQTLTDTQKTQARSNIGLSSVTRGIIAADTLVQSDHGKLIIVSSASNFTLAVTAAATLGDGWYCDIYNQGTSIITIDPNAAEVIDSLATATIWPLERFRIWCTGTGFITGNHGGEWRSYTPVLTATGGGSPTGTVAGRFKKVRSSIQFSVYITGLGGTGVNYLQASLPVQMGASAVGCFAVQESAVNGKSLTAYATGGSTSCMYRYADATASANTAGATYTMNGAYECALNGSV